MRLTISRDDHKGVNLRIDGTTYVANSKTWYDGNGRFIWDFGGFSAYHPIETSDDQAWANSHHTIVVDGPVYVDGARACLQYGTISDPGGYLNTVDNFVAHYHVDQLLPGPDPNRTYTRRQQDPYASGTFRTLGIVPGQYEGGLRIGGLYQSDIASWAVELAPEWLGQTWWEGHGLFATNTARANCQLDIDGLADHNSRFGFGSQWNTAPYVLVPDRRVGEPVEPADAVSKMELKLFSAVAYPGRW